MSYRSDCTGDGPSSTRSASRVPEAPRAIDAGATRVLDSSNRVKSHTATRSSTLGQATSSSATRVAETKATKRSRLLGVGVFSNSLQSPDGVSSGCETAESPTLVSAQRQQCAASVAARWNALDSPAQVDVAAVAARFEQLTPPDAYDPPAVTSSELQKNDTAASALLAALGEAGHLTAAATSSTLKWQLRPRPSNVISWSRRYIWLGPRR